MTSWDQQFVLSFMAGASAGLSVDLIIFPLDTLKTRLQSPQGFVKAGGFSKLYAGLASVIFGAAPGSAAFFVTYDSFKRILSPWSSPSLEPVAHMCAASLGEVMACLIRVPVEVVKQRTQAQPSVTSWITLKDIIARDGAGGLFRGYGSTVLREMPFSFIQFPVWEVLKKFVSDYQGRSVTPFETALCGAAAGGFAAATTTPLDVAKTRIMLHRGQAKTVTQTLAEVYQQGGAKGVLNRGYHATFKAIRWSNPEVDVSLVGRLHFLRHIRKVTKCTGTNRVNWDLLKKNCFSGVSLNCTVWTFIIIKCVSFYSLLFSTKESKNLVLKRQATVKAETI
ncbi:S-adenosylmethionine mitochondrial carrier protein-like isoform X3 [Varroa destructor]|nr:S-adenosylmethionine mitochondrial carrier protein-like isoform X3 [Varroa destructor]XP_022647021.1 S-adenosylmethionine mitochondrial carrier protein-like isoform X3 [Varroa destructor]